MKSKLSRTRRRAPDRADAFEALYLDFLRSFYEQEDKERARKLASRLEATLASRPDLSDSIQGEEIRSLLAELVGDLEQAIRCRESEIRKILELHSQSRDTPAWSYVFRQYDYSDVSDRLDLLAILFAEQGDVNRAVATLKESRQFCEAHDIPFDGQDLLKEYEQARGGQARRGLPQPRRRRVGARSSEAR